MHESRNKLRVAVVGASGYTGSELVRLLCAHPHAELTLICGESTVGQRFSELHPQFLGIVDSVLEPGSAVRDAALDIIFLALPHGVSMDFVAGLPAGHPPVIDLSGDFRLNSPASYAEWYGAQHACPELLGQAVYGLPELNRAQIAKAQLVANPGCYPTSAILPLAPLLRAGLLEPAGIIIDSKSGVSGAGNKPRSNTHFPAQYGNFSAYGLQRHRHTPEIEQTLGKAAGQGITLQFTPHLLPVSRGILSTIYARPRPGVDEARLQDALQQAYGAEAFVRLREQAPQLSEVRGSNFCDIHLELDRRSGNIIIISVIDNLVKGAAGQAVQNMNIIAGLPEACGLGQAALSP